MRCLFIILSICCVVAVAENQKHRNKCRPDYTYDDPTFVGWLKYHEVPATWHDARLQCEYEGAVLASPVNYYSLDFLKPRIGDCEDKMVFTGIHSTYSPGNFATIEGRLLSQFNHKWAPGEPDNYENKESCTAMLQDGTLADVNCNQTLSYLCYIASPTVCNNNELVDSYFNTTCDTIDKDYVFKPETGSCYKFHKTVASWSVAHRVCMAERATLAIINSAVESNVLKQMYEDAATDLRAIYADMDNPNETYDIFHVHIGFTEISDRVIRRLWRTIEGQTLETAGFSTFAFKEPNHLEEQCGSFCGDSGHLNDIHCTEKLAPFMCEKKAEKDDWPSSTLAPLAAN